jgi:hypothetical protein
MIKYRITNKGANIAEILPGSDPVGTPEDMLDIMGDARYNGCDAIIIHRESLHPDFFDLKTKLAGEILQKFSNYRMRLAITGDFSEIKSKSLRDFIRESNRTGIIWFVETLEEALSKLDR